MRANLQKVTNAHISKVLKVGMRTIDRTKKKFVEEGFEAALECKPTDRVYESNVFFVTIFFLTDLRRYF